MMRILRKMNKQDKAIVLFCMLIILLVLTFSLFYIRKSSIPVSHQGSLTTPKPALVVQPNQAVLGDPTSLSINSIGLSLAVIHGSQYANGTWTLTPDKVQYAVISPEPNNHEGNTVIYGHATKAVFGHLYQMTKGDIATINTSNGYSFRYRYEGNYAVSPYDFSIFSYKGAPILTLQTCSGTFYQNRQMYQFSYVGYEKTK